VTVASVFEKMRGAVALLEEVADELEPGTLDVAGAKRLVDLSTRCERLAMATRGRAARRVQDAVIWKRDQHGSAARWLASTTGSSVGAAARSLEAARQLEELPATAAAFRRGEISEAQAAEIAATATVDPSAESRLLATATGWASFKTFRDECRDATVRARDDRLHAQWLHENRSVHTWSERNGHFRIDARLSPDEAGWVNNALEQKTSELFTAAQQAGGVLEPREAYRADAMVALLRGEAPLKPLEARLDADQAAIERGYVEPGERCELVGIGPIPVTMARSMLSDARVTILVRNGTEITTISSPNRTIPAKLRKWLERAYSTCGVAGCGNDQRLQIDHIIEVEDGGPTVKENLWRLCVHHHKLKTFYQWRVVEDNGIRQLVAPDDPDPP
jgi:Domain of unknown function (DUF222)/HNH endonuclease